MSTKPDQERGTVEAHVRLTLPQKLMLADAARGFDGRMWDAQHRAIKTAKRLTALGLGEYVHPCFKINDAGRRAIGLEPNQQGSGA